MKISVEFGQLTPTGRDTYAVGPLLRVTAAPAVPLQVVVDAVLARSGKAGRPLQYMRTAQRRDLLGALAQPIGELGLGHSAVVHWSV